MVRRRLWMLIGLMVGWVLMGCAQIVTQDTTTPRMTKQELKAHLGNPDLVVVDVRLSDEWKKSDLKIKSAVREDPEKDFRTWASKYPKDKTLVFY